MQGENGCFSHHKRTNALPNNMGQKSVELFTARTKESCQGH